MLSLLLTTTLASMASALAIRAGGPPFVPIPSNCTVPNPLPPPALNYSTNGLSVSPSTLNSSGVYSYYLALPDYQPMSERWEGCLEQCNGLGGCVSAFMADGVKTPKGYYGTSGGTPSRACLMFDRYLEGCDFVAAEGVGNATAGNIEFPSS